MTRIALLSSAAIAFAVALPGGARAADLYGAAGTEQVETCLSGHVCFPITIPVTRLRYEAQPGERNVVTLVWSAGYVYLTDQARFAARPETQPFTGRPTLECSLEAAGEPRTSDECWVHDAYWEQHVRLGDGDDVAIVDFGSTRVNSLDGGPGNDVLTVTTGSAVTITGGPGRDVIRGGLLGDRIWSRDNAVDVVDCGRGKDVVEADRHDLIGSGCETVRIG